MSQVVRPQTKKPAEATFLRNRRGLGFVALTLALAVTVLFPIVSLVVMAMSGTAYSLNHVVQHVLPRTLWTTALLMVGRLVNQALLRWQC